MNASTSYLGRGCIFVIIENYRIEGGIFLQIRTATVQDLSQICAFYKQVCLDQKTDDYSPDWHWGVYPSEEGLKQQINNATVIIATDNDKVIELCRSC